MNSILSGKVFCRWQRLALAGALLMAGLVSSPAQTDQPKPAPRRASVVLIIADDLGYGDLGCYGQKNVKTPNLDKLAEEGVRFTSFYGGGAAGAQSRASLLTGRNAAHLSDSGLLPSDAVTLAQHLKDAGYRTGFIGQWGLDGLPENKGFDQVAATLDESAEFNHYPVRIWRYDNIGLMTNATFTEFPDNDGGMRMTYFPDLFTTAAMNYIANNKPDQFNKYRSFFLCVSYNVPHAKLDLTDIAAYSDQKWPVAEKIRAAMISRLDADVGKIRARLEEQKIADNTIIIFTSGNGPHTNGVDPKLQKSAGILRGVKGELYEGGIRVPMIVWCPAKIKAGVNGTAWANWDILPTLADVAWTQPPEKIDGLSFWPTLLGKAQTNQHEFLYWEASASGARAARMGDWKGVRPQAGAPLELFNLKTDAYEKQNVADKNSTVVGKIEDYLKTVRAVSVP
jgi:arylsulfatase A-like enzyme